MITRHDIMKMARTVLRNDERRFDRSIMHVERDWFIGLCLGLLVLALGGWWSVTTYRAYDDASLTSEAEAEAPVVYRARQVQAALEIVEQQQQQFAALTGTPPEADEAPVVEDEPTPVPVTATTSDPSGQPGLVATSTATTSEPTPTEEPASATSSAPAPAPTEVAPTPETAPQIPAGDVEASF